MSSFSISQDPGCLYWICDACQRIQPQEVTRCDTCGTPARKPIFLPLDLAREAADAARIDALLCLSLTARAIQPVAPAGRNTQPIFIQPKNKESLREITRAEATHAARPELVRVGVEPFRISEDPFEKAARVSPPRPATRQAVYRRTSRRNLPFSEFQFYSLAILLTGLILAAWLIWVYAPRTELVTVKSLYWSASVPLEKALLVETPLSATGDSPEIPGNWTAVDYFKTMGYTKETYLPRIALPSGNYRVGEATWAFMVTFVDQNNVSYPEFLPESAWRKLEVGQDFMARIKNGRITGLQAHGKD